MVFEEQLSNAPPPENAHLTCYDLFQRHLVSIALQED